MTGVIRRPRSPCPCFHLFDGNPMLCFPPFPPSPLSFFPSPSGAAGPAVTLLINSAVPSASAMSLVIPTNFQHILRVLNTNIDGKRNIMFAMTAIKGIGRRYANLVLKKVRNNVAVPGWGDLSNVSLPFCSSK